jgi:hypothetical protein
MVEATLRGLARRVRSLTPRAAVLAGGVLMVVGQVILVIMLLAGAPMPSLDVTGLLVGPVLLAGIALLWLGPVVVAMAGGQPAWIGAIAFPAGFAVWALGTVLAEGLSDSVALSVVEGALPVFSFAGALAVVGGGRVWPRLAGVAVIAGLWGAISYPLEAVVGRVIVGLTAAVAFLVWVSLHTPPPITPGSPVVTGHRDS